MPIDEPEVLVDQIEVLPKELEVVEMKHESAEVLPMTQALLAGEQKPTYGWEAA